MNYSITLTALSAFILAVTNYIQISDLRKEESKTQKSISDLNTRIDALNERIKLERQDSFSSFEDLRDRFREKNLEAAKLFNELEKAKKKKK